MAGRVAIGHEVLTALVCEQHDEDATWIVANVNAERDGKAVLMVQCLECAKQSAQRSVEEWRDGLAKAENLLQKINAG